MTFLRSFRASCALLALAAAVHLPSTAQTVANGPYYATPAWDQKLQCDTAATCPRFVVLANWNSEAVLDRETGLVWERQPGLAPSDTPQQWAAAVDACTQKSTGGRKGWRLPSMPELSSLVEGATGKLPPGHPFLNIDESRFGRFYWTETRLPGAPLEFAYQVGFGGFSGTGQLTLRHSYWCVRGAGGRSD